MKKIISICLISFITACQQIQIDNPIIKIKTFEEIKLLINDKESFLLYVGRSDCSDCTILEKQLSTISIPKNIKFFKLDIREYRALAKVKNATQYNIDYYSSIIEFFHLKWTPTLYFINNGKIVSEYQYLDKSYHSLSLDKKTQSKKLFDRKLEEYITTTTQSFN